MSPEETDIEDAPVEDTRTLSDVENPTPKRGYLDRMLSPIKMTETKWAGKSMWVCSHCRTKTFDKSEAEAHRC